jgi:hypothetical protein
MGEIVNQYKKILAGELNRFSPHTWSSPNSKEIFTDCFRYIVQELGMDRTDILQVKPNIFFEKYKLNGGYQRIYKRDYVEAARSTFPKLNLLIHQFDVIPNKYWEIIGLTYSLRNMYAKRLRWDREEMVTKTNKLIFQSNDLLHLLYTSIDSADTTISYFLQRIMNVAFPDYNFTLAEIEKMFSWLDIVEYKYDLVMGCIQ